MKLLSAAAEALFADPAPRARRTRPASAPILASATALASALLPLIAMVEAYRLTA